MAATSSSCCCPTRRRRARSKSPSASAVESTPLPSTRADATWPRASASASPATRKTARRSMRSRHTPTAPSIQPSRTAATARSSSARRQLKLPEFTDHGHTELAVRLALHQPETQLRIDGARRGEIRVRPEHELAVARSAREVDALLDEAPAEAFAACRGLDE